MEGVCCIVRKDNLKKLAACIAVAALCGTALWKLQDIQQGSAAGEPSTLAQLAGLSGRTSAGYTAGAVYSADGLKISAEENGKIYAAPGFPLLGSSSSGGAICRWADVLCSADGKNREGASIQTTLSYEGQMTAAQLLAEKFPPSVCDSAAVAVLTRDGGILVSAGSNLCDASAYFSEDAAVLEPALCNYAAEQYQTGSVVKPLMARILLCRGGELAPEWRIESSFEDWSFCNIPGGKVIHNHDFADQSAYTSVREDGCMVRYISFADALKKSSNTYFLRHMLALGGGEPMAAYRAFCGLFGSDVPIQTDLCTLPAVSYSPDGKNTDASKLYWWFWGQSFYTSCIRLAQLQNHALSGTAYAPFCVSAVYLDSEKIYEADPMPRADLSFSAGENDTLKNAMADCFGSYDIAPEVLAPYRKYLRGRRFLGKSGTADTNQELGRINAVRTLTVLDESGDVTCTAVILAHNIRSGVTNSTELYSILLDTLTAAGVLEQGE